MRIDNNNTSPDFDYSDFSSRASDESSPSFPQPKTEQEWIDWLNGIYRTASRDLNGKPGSAEKLAKLRTAIDAAIKGIKENFQDHPILLLPESIKTALKDVIEALKECAPYSPNPTDFMTRANAQNAIVTEQENIIDSIDSYQKKETQRYKDTMQVLRDALMALLESLPPSASGARDLIQNTIGKLNEQLQELEKTKTSTEFFSKTNINNIEKAISDAQYVISKVKNPDLSNDFPMDPKKKGFDTSIPRNPDGSIDVKALSKKLHDLLYYMYHGDPTNFNIYTAIAGYLTNIAGVWDQLSEKDKASFNNTMGQVPDMDGKSLGLLLGKSVVFGKFYNLGGNEKLLREFIDQLIYKLDGKDSPFIKDLLAGIKYAGNSLSDNEYFSINPNNGQVTWKKDYQGFLTKQSLQDAGIGRSKKMSKFFSSFMSAKMKELEALANGDPFLLFYLILMELFNSNDNYQVQIAGVGNTLEKLTGLTNKAAELGLLFQKITGRAKTDKTDADFQETFGMIKDYMNKAEDFFEEFRDDPRISDSFAELEDAFKHLFGSGPAGLSTGYKDYKGDDVPPLKNLDGTDASLGDAFKNFKNGLDDPRAQQFFVERFHALCGPGKELVDDKGNPLKDKEGRAYAPQAGKHYTQLTTDVITMSKAPTNMNSTLTIKMEDIKATAEQFGAMITKFAKEPNELVHRMLERIKS